MYSQKNEAMNKSIMRYCPKDKTLCRTMVLTSWIHLAIGIDSLGHQSFFEEVFSTMGFTRTHVTFSGLRRMWKKRRVRKNVFWTSEGKKKEADQAKRSDD
jgi:hypothetical protein